VDIEVEIKDVPLKAIRTNGGTQHRQIDMEVAREYADRLVGGSEPPPVKVVFDGKDYWLWDGFHRYKMLYQRNRQFIKAEVSTGTRGDAVWLSYSANKDHGVRRQAGVVKEIILKIVRDPETRNLPHTEIARHVGVSRQYVSRVVADHATEAHDAPEAPQERTVMRGGTTYPQKKRGKAMAKEAPLPGTTGDETAVASDAAADTITVPKAVVAEATPLAIEAAKRPAEYPALADASRKAAFRSLDAKVSALKDDFSPLCEGVAGQGAVAHRHQFEDGVDHLLEVIRSAAQETGGRVVKSQG
jgi:hypothetical protein